MVRTDLSLVIGIAILGVAVRGDPKFSNLYGSKEFDPNEVDADIVPGLLDLMKKADRFARNAQPDTTPQDGKTYDFVVVGAGSAGCAVASRLSEIKKFEVLLIEAGDEETLALDVPLVAVQAQESNRTNWAYMTEPSDKYCLAMKDRRCAWPRGKGMGGTSVLNYMVATRGTPADFDEWAAEGNEGWAHRDVLKYFRKLETMKIPELAKDREHHGTKGPITVSYAPFRSPLAYAFLDAATELGMPLIDYNAKDSIGYSPVQSTTSNGTRMSSNRAYLHGKLRKNLSVTKNSVARKILIDPQTKTAKGVEFVKNGKVIKVYTRKEVILSSGAVGSPHLLMLSGIGPKKHLEELGIPVLKDLPVGENLHDHIAYCGLSFKVDQPISMRPTHLFKASTPYVRDYIKHQTGPIAVPGGAEVIGWADAFNPHDLKATPNIEQVLLSQTFGADAGLPNAMNIRDDLVEKLTKANDVHGWLTLPMLLKPKSRGWVRLRSKDINDHPIVQPNYLDHPDDMQALIAGVNMSLAFGNTRAMQKLHAKPLVVEIEECKKHKGNFNQYMECMIRHYTMTVYHPCGTCKMGVESNPTAVVNSKLQVIGVEKLRVVDASIMPVITSAHLNLATYMIAEKASDMIKQYWGYPVENS